MDKFKSDAHCINTSINTVFSKLSDPSLYKKLIDENADRLPEEARKNLDKLKFEGDHIDIESPMGAISFGINHAATVAPKEIVYSALNSPVKFNLVIKLKELSENSTELVSILEADLPIFVKTMVSPQITEAAKQFGKVLASLPYDTL